MVYRGAFFAGKQLQEGLVYLFELAIHDIGHGHGLASSKAVSCRFCVSTCSASESFRRISAASRSLRAAMLRQTTK